MFKISTLLSFLAFLAALSIGLIFLVPSWREMNSLKIIKAQKQEELKVAQSIVDRIEELSRQYEEAKDDLEKLSLAIPSGSQVPELAIQFEDMAKRSGLIIGNVEFGKKEEIARDGQKSREEVKSADISMMVEGSYANFKNFLNDIENNIRLMDVSAISFEKTAETEKSGVIQYKISINSYYLSQ